MDGSSPSGAEAVAAVSARFAASLATGVAAMAVAPPAVKESGSMRVTMTNVNGQLITAATLEEKRKETPDFDSIKRQVFLTAKEGGPKRLLQHLRSVLQGPSGREMLQRLGSAQEDLGGSTLLAYAIDPDFASSSSDPSTSAGDETMQELTDYDDHAEAACRFLILEADADVNDRGGSSESVLEMAVSCGCEPVAELLLQNGADSESKAEALYLAAHEYDYDMLKLLLEFAADSALDEEGNTALSVAARNGETSIVERLLAAGVNIFKQDASGNAAAEVARAAGREDLAQLITTEVCSPALLVVVCIAYLRGCCCVVLKRGRTSGA
ncbi:hypothetical protein BBJ28_00013812 [Nothophytophthora sp. Chile5]|nr:hypothetical protein BBJ28_00013812 [Nothophytophthora sp. Chile5]